MINLLEIALFLVKLTMHPSLFSTFTMLLAREHLKRGFLLDQLTLKYSYPKNPPKIVKIVLSHMHIEEPITRPEPTRNRGLEVR